MITGIRLPQDQLLALRLEDVQLYLESRRWHVDSAKGNGLATYYRNDEAKADILLPRDRDLADYTERMADMLLTLAAVENRTVWEILNDVSGPPADVLRIAIGGPSAMLGAIPLDRGLDLLQRGRELLNAAACHVHQPQAFYPKLYFKEADEFLAGCKLGQTERNGAFIVKIASPVPPLLVKQGSLFEPGIPDTAFEGEPFARQVTWRLMGALQTVGDEVASGHFDRLLSAVPSGVTANLCDTLVAMLPDDEQSTLKFSMSWSRNRPVVPRSIGSQVRFSSGASPILRSVGQSLRDRGTPKAQEVRGYIITLHATNTLLEGFEGQVDITTEFGRVRLLLALPEYQSACDAHKNLKRVSATGLLKVGAKHNSLLHPRDFRVLQDPS